MSDIKIIWDGAAMEELMHGPDGPIGRFLYTRAEYVKQGAVIQCPKRTTLLSKSILKRPVQEAAGGLGIIVGAYQPYAVFVHEGTKDHGPVNAKALRFIGSDGKVVFAARVRGIKANHFLSDNLRLFFA